jgi:hypothetical protein
VLPQRSFFVGNADRLIFCATMPFVLVQQINQGN